MALHIHLKTGREIPLLRGHPWVMSGAISRLEGDPTRDEAAVLAADGRFIGMATVHPTSEIRARIFSTASGDALDAQGILTRIAAARDRRLRWMPRGSEAMRVVFSESDNLPGLIVDRFSDTLVVQFLTAPMDKRRDGIVRALTEAWNPRTIWERSDVDARRHEGLEPRKGLLSGQPLNGPVSFTEGGLRFLADIESGHKTGFYLDQQSNRARIAAWVRQLGNPRVLNVFAYTDSFGIVALAAGAGHVVSVDSSAAAGELAERQHALNPLSLPERREYRIGKAFETLRAIREAGEQFDLVILDPPRLVNRKDRMHQGLRAYKDINLQACQLVAPGGLLATFSCSGLLDRELFGKVIEGAARDARRPAQFIEELGLPPDHPHKPGFPESAYLKGFVVGL